MNGSDIRDLGFILSRTNQFVIYRDEHFDKRRNLIEHLWTKYERVSFQRTIKAEKGLKSAKSGSKSFIEGLKNGRKCQVCQSSLEFLKRKFICELCDKVVCKMHRAAISPFDSNSKGGRIIVCGACEQAISSHRDSENQKRRIWDVQNLPVTKHYMELCELKCELFVNMSRYSGLFYTLKGLTGEILFKKNLTKKKGIVCKSDKFCFVPEGEGEDRLFELDGDLKIDDDFMRKQLSLVDCETVFHFLENAHSLQNRICGLISQLAKPKIFGADTKSATQKSFESALHRSIRDYLSLILPEFYFFGNRLQLLQKAFTELVSRTRHPDDERRIYGMSPTHQNQLDRELAVDKNSFHSTGSDSIFIEKVIPEKCPLSPGFPITVMGGGYSTSNTRVVINDKILPDDRVLIHSEEKLTFLVPSFMEIGFNTLSLLDCINGCKARFHRGIYAVECRGIT